MFGVACRARNGEGGTWQVVDAPGSYVLLGLSPRHIVDLRATAEEAVMERDGAWGMWWRIG